MTVRFRFHAWMSWRLRIQCGHPTVTESSWSGGTRKTDIEVVKQGRQDQVGVEDPLGGVHEQRAIWRRIDA